VVIVVSLVKLLGSHLNHIQVIHDGHPYWATHLTVLHHLLGHHPRSRFNPRLPVKAGDAAAAQLAELDLDVSIRACR